MKRMMKQLFVTVWLAMLVNVRALEAIPSTINTQDMGDHYKVWFVCESQKTYAIYASETSEEEDAFWFHIKTITPGQNHSIVSEVGGTTVVTTTLPKPFLNWLTEPGPGFLKVVETAVPTVSESDFVQVTDFKHMGEFVRVSFESEFLQKYTVWGSDDLKDWVPVDTLEGGERLQTLEVFGEGDTTTVDIPIPFLPWFDPSKSFVRVSKKSSDFFGGFSARAALVVAPAPKTWMLVCTRDGHVDAPISNDGKLVMAVGSEGPKRKDTGKYMWISAVSLASRKALLGDFEVRIPWENPETEETEKLIQTIRLSHYEGEETPTIIYDPDPDKRAAKDDILHSQLGIHTGTVIGIAVFEPKKILENNVELEQQGITFNIKIPDASASTTVQQAWAFSAMDLKTYGAFCAMIDKAGKED